MAALHPYHAAVFQRFYLLCAGLKDTTMPAADFMRSDGTARLSMYESIVLPVLVAGEYPQLDTQELNEALEQVKLRLFELHDEELAQKTRPSSSPSFR